MLSIIIVSWNVRDLLEKCLRSIYTQTNNISFEVFVVDNGSSDKTCEMVKQKFPIVKLIANTENRGFAAANNQALKKAQAEFLLLLNPDTEILDNALEKMVCFMQTHLNCGILGGHLKNPDGSHQDSLRRFPSVWDQSFILLKFQHLWPRARVLQRYLMKDNSVGVVAPAPTMVKESDKSLRKEVILALAGQSELEQIKGIRAGALTRTTPTFYQKPHFNLDQVMGAFFMIRREVVDQIGFLDENYFAWFEEVDFCMRAKNKGWEVCYTADAEIIHHFGQSFKQMMTVEKQKIWNRSARHYFKKNHSIFAFIWITIMSWIGLRIVCLVDVLQKFKCQNSNVKQNPKSK